MYLTTRGQRRRAAEDRKRRRKVAGKGGKTRYLPLHPATNELINDYLDAAGHGLDEAGALFRPVRDNRTWRLEAAITADGVAVPSISTA